MKKINGGKIKTRASIGLVKKVSVKKIVNHLDFDFSKKILLSSIKYIVANKNVMNEISANKGIVSPPKKIFIERQRITAEIAEEKLFV